VKLDPETGLTAHVQRLPEVEFFNAGHIEPATNWYVFMANDFDDATGEHRMYSVNLEDSSQTFDTLCSFVYPLFITTLVSAQSESYSIGFLRDNEPPNFSFSFLQFDNENGHILQTFDMPDILPQSDEITLDIETDR